MLIRYIAYTQFCLSLKVESLHSLSKAKFTGILMNKETTAKETKHSSSFSLKEEIFSTYSFEFLTV